MYYKILTINQYLEKYPEMGKDEWFVKCSEQEEGEEKIGILEFEEDSYAIGSGFTGNVSIYKITDFSKYKVVKGKKRIEIENGIRFEDSLDMNDKINYNLKSIKDLVNQELESNKTSIFTFPYRFIEKYNKHLLCKVDDIVCQKSNYPKELISKIESELKPIEWYSVLKNINRLTWSLESPSIEAPIEIRIYGCDDGAVEGIFENINEAEEKLKRQSYDLDRKFKKPFFYTD